MAITMRKKPALMSPRIAQHWITHLRSGWYEEKDPKVGVYLMRDTSDRFSPFGVLCNIYAQHHPEVAMHEKHKHFFLGVQMYLPRRVLDWADMKGTRLQEIASTSTEKALSREVGFSDLFDVQKALGFSGFADFLEEHVVKHSPLVLAHRFGREL